LWEVFFFEETPDLLKVPGINTGTQCMQCGHHPGKLGKVRATSESGRGKIREN